MLEFKTPLPMKCTLCGKAITKGEPCHAILPGTAADEHAFYDKGSIGLVCSCLQRAVESYAIEHMANPTIPIQERISRALDGHTSDIGPEILFAYMANPHIPLRERIAQTLDDDAGNETDFTACMTPEPKPDHEVKPTVCPKCEHGCFIPIDFDGTVACTNCGKAYYSQPPQFISSAYVPTDGVIENILARPSFESGLLENEQNNIKKDRCPTCNRDITEFRDASSEKEFKISGLCQECQDTVFGV